MLGVVLIGGVEVFVQFFYSLVPLTSPLEDKELHLL